MLKKSLLIGASIFLVIFISILYRVNTSLNDTEITIPDFNEIVKPTDESTMTTTKSNKEEEKEKPEDFYALLIGIDFRVDPFTLNTDSIIVAHIIPQNKSVKLVSIPRDTRVKFDGQLLKLTSYRDYNPEYVKINSTFSDGYQHTYINSKKDPSILSGERITVNHAKLPEEYISSGMVVLRDEVEELLDIEIDYSFLVNFQTVVSLVDAVGGIDVYVDRDMQYDDSVDNTSIHLSQGQQILNGQNALNFARFRQDNRGEAFYSSDFDRSRRQQEVILATLDKIASWENINQVFELLDIVTENFKTDMNKTKMLMLVKDFYGISSDSIITVPFEGRWQSPYVVINDEALDKVKDDFKSIEMISNNSNLASQ
ncbi:LCP family protein [Chengkuizengella marina]|uniref:LytR family transcriptional regulator n=1 Tax=Chengkuizengella marina TaxID=2507566 RepID=A0A6N9Q7P6_9BACL|nr:LCP family protein [Chengkuizengella marina]NBI30654.1 LytR family transcriptional regulator [Chengkuizengella marina]